MDHNTVNQTGNMISPYGTPMAGFVFINNLLPNNLYGVKGSGAATGTATLAAYFPGYSFENNVIIGGAAKSYPAGNDFPSTWAAVGFLNLAGNDYELTASSPYHHAATDGTDIGCIMLMMP